jgi:hypothetical protein
MVSRTFEPGRSDNPQYCIRPTRGKNTGNWVEQDSNLRRQCHQIYSLAPLAAWVSTRSRERRLGPSPLRHRLEGFSLNLRSKRSRAGGESRTHNRRFTKPVLCRLSYASVREAMKLLTITRLSSDARAIRPRAASRRTAPIFRPYPNVLRPWLARDSARERLARLELENPPVRQVHARAVSTDQPSRGAVGRSWDGRSARANLNGAWRRNRTCIFRRCHRGTARTGRQVAASSAEPGAGE